MRRAVKMGDSGWINLGKLPLQDGWVLAPDPVPANPIWDDLIQNIREKTQAELDAEQALEAAEVADLAVWTAEKQDLKDRVTTALTRLQQIQDAAAPTNAQVIAAVRDLAQYLEVVVRALRRMA